MKFTETDIWNILQDVKDPEIPVLSITDLGIVRHIELTNENIPEQKVNISITPTYTGCPALNVINMDIRLKLLENGIKNIIITSQLSPAWTTEWISEKGKEKLKQYGISPPNAKQQFCSSDMFSQEAVQCPRCNSYHTELVSQFASTACKALYKCLNCLEPFDYFKCH